MAAGCPFDVAVPMSQFSEVELAVRSIIQRASWQELTAVVDGSDVNALLRSASESFRLLHANAPVVTPTAAEAVCLTSKHCLAIASKVGLSCVAVAELASEGIAGAAALFQPGFVLDEKQHIGSAALESLSEVLDDFKLDIFSTLRRLEELLKPRWVLSGGGRGGRITFEAASEAGELIVEGSLRLYRALEGVCVWSLALVARIVGYSGLTGNCLWEFASVSHDCVLYAKAALCFHQDVGTLPGEASQLRVPCDLAAVRGAILNAVFGLIGADVAFLSCSNTEDASISIQERNEILLNHHACLAAATAESGLLDCLLGNSWVECPTAHPGVPALASFLAAFSSATVHPDAGELVDGMMQQLRLRSSEVWDALASATSRTNSFAMDCAALSYAMPPPAQARVAILNVYISETSTDELHKVIDPCNLAALVAFVANSGCTPGDDSLTTALQGLGFEVRAGLTSRLQNWRGPVHTTALRPWIEYLNAPPHETFDGDGGLNPPDTVSASSVVVPTGSIAVAPGIRDLARDAPHEFCCALDGGVLVDPVRTPAGLVFERSALALSLTANGGHCPITHVPLDLSECHRDTDLRKRILQWVRASRPRRRAAQAFRRS